MKPMMTFNLVLIVGMFSTAPATGDQATGASQASVTATPDQPATVTAEQPAATSQSAPVAPRPAIVPVQIDRTQIPLEVVRDKRDLSADEAIVYYGLLDHVRRVDAQALWNAGAAFVHTRWELSRQDPQLRHFKESEFPLFVDMIRRPEDYRGQPVIMRGHIIRLTSYPALENDYGIVTLYEAWLVTDDAQSNPTTVIFTEKPAGLPLGEQVIDGITVCGYFLKLNTYPARDEMIRFAPLVLARTVTWRQVRRDAFPWMAELGYATVGIVGLLVGVLVWNNMRQGRRRRAQRLAALDAEPFNPQSLAAADTTGTEDHETDEPHLNP